MSDWRPIETAPERELVLVWQEFGGIVLRSYQSGEWWTEDEFLDDSGLEITHWMPLPEPPSDS